MLLNIILAIFTIVIIYICLSFLSDIYKGQYRQIKFQNAIIKYQYKQKVELRNEIKYYNDNLHLISKAYQSFLKKDIKC